MSDGFFRYRYRCSQNFMQAVQPWVEQHLWDELVSVSHTHNHQRQSRWSEQQVDHSSQFLVVGFKLEARIMDWLARTNGSAL